MGAVNRHSVTQKNHHSRDVRRGGHLVVLLPRLLLQLRWQALMLSKVGAPPLLRGMTWSAVQLIE
jgi:hypothetical protein